VLPRDVPVLPVGGITPDNMAPWVAAGARGFGIGSALYAPGSRLDDTAARARAFAQAWHSLSTHA
jgi:2-dehydro-3-deoxyphosphogalactonate aldolase